MSTKIASTLAALPLALACGGGQPGAASANDAKTAGDAETDPSAASGSGNGGGEGESGPSLPSCDDGTCFRCGDGICPKGFYCDQDAQGGPACGWLPACADEASCACVKQAFGGSCTCEEQGAGVTLDCE